MRHLGALLPLTVLPLPAPPFVHSSLAISRNHRRAEVWWGWSRMRHAPRGVKEDRGGLKGGGGGQRKPQADVHFRAYSLIIRQALLRRPIDRSLHVESRISPRAQPLQPPEPSALELAALELPALEPSALEPLAACSSSSGSTSAFSGWNWKTAIATREFNRSCSNRSCAIRSCAIRFRVKSLFASSKHVSARFSAERPAESHKNWRAETEKMASNSALRNGSASEMSACITSIPLLCAARNISKERSTHKKKHKR